MCHIRRRLLLLCELGTDGLCLLLVAWLLKKGEHILLVSLNTWLVEGVDTEDVARDTTTQLEEIYELTVVVGVELLNRDEDVWHTTVNVSEASTELCVLVYLVDALASEEVQTVKVLLILWEEQLIVWILYRDAGLEDGALAVLNPLAHRVQVGSEVA